MNSLTVTIKPVERTDRCEAGFIGTQRLERLFKEAGELRPDEKIVELTFSSEGIRFIVEKAPLKP